MCDKCEYNHTQVHMNDRCPVCRQEIEFSKAAAPPPFVQWLRVLMMKGMMVLGMAVAVGALAVEARARWTDTDIDAAES